MANPYIHAVALLLSDAVPTYTAIVTKEATMRILRVKSSRASMSNSQKPGGYFAGF